MGSGDFSRQAVTPQPIDIEALCKEAGKGALHDAKMNFDDWDRLLVNLSEFALSIMVARLIELGHQEMTVLDLGVLMDICHEDGSWI
jgi:hypothetical protein